MPSLSHLLYFDVASIQTPTRTFSFREDESYSNAGMRHKARRTLRDKELFKKAFAERYRSQVPGSTNDIKAKQVYISMSESPRSLTATS